jgi:hypothetical protein|nr:MAG TPA: hypothetical protein [Caudoviricetes sp.]
MNITLDTKGKTTNYCGAQFISIEEGKAIFFRGKDEHNAVEIPLNRFKHVDVEISIRNEGNSYFDYAEDLKIFAETIRSL